MQITRNYICVKYGLVESNHFKCELPDGWKIFKLIKFVETYSIMIYKLIIFRSDMESEKKDSEVEKKTEKTGSSSEHQMNSFQIKRRMSVALKKRLKDNETDQKINDKKT